MFLRSSADIAVYGGAAGAGKSYALLMEALRGVSVTGYSAVIFRRTCPQITTAGGLWQTSMDIYSRLGGRPRESTLEWIFPNSVGIKFAHMQYASDRYDWDGAQICFLGFDQLEHFEWSQFFYMLSRNRSTCGVRPYVRATCNPDPDHWLRRFMDWWIDDSTGLPVVERSGVVRYFVAINDMVHWAGTPEELEAEHGKDCTPKSFTFVAGTVEDNKILLAGDPGYMANLNALPRVARERLRCGNWNAREVAGEFFNRDWFETVAAAPRLSDEIRYWDRASTEVAPGQASGASWTAGVRQGRAENGLYFVTDVRRDRRRPLGVQTLVTNTASQDGLGVRVGIEGDPGQAGVAEAAAYVRLLAGYVVQVNTVRESKGVRARPYAVQCEAGNVKLVRGDWNEDFLNEHHNFVPGTKCVSDQVDASSGGHHMLNNEKECGIW
jgi:predicted phage terminase large subunit-like protein